MYHGIGVKVEVKVTDLMVVNTCQCQACTGWRSILVSVKRAQGGGLAPLTARADSLEVVLGQLGSEEADDGSEMMLLIHRRG